MSSEVNVSKQPNIFSRLYNGETNFNIVGRWKLWFAVSALLMLVSVASVGIKGLNLGIDFTGGTVWEVPAGEVSAAQVDDAMASLGYRDVQVQELTQVSAGGARIFRVEAEASASQAEDASVSEELAKLTGSDVAEVTVDRVGPSWAETLTEKARTALIVFMIGIMAYITLRFEFKMALATVAALIHDLVITVGVYSLFSFPVTPATVIALLTILGFSIYDGIVVFDRVDENRVLLGRSMKMTYSDMANLSLNQVLMRSLNTSITALLPILSILVVGSWILGEATLQEFGLALFVGVMLGAYSSLYIATPLLAVLKEREPRYQEIRERLGASANERGPVVSPVGAEATAESASSPVSGEVAPRPRKQGRKR